MKALLCLLSSVLFSTAFGIEPVLSTVLDEITLANGRSYENVRVIRVEADALTFQHGGGIARIPFEQFSGELRERFGYDPKASAAAREDYRNRQRAKFLLEVETERELQKAKMIARAIAEWERSRCSHEWHDRFTIVPGMGEAPGPVMQRERHPVPDAYAHR